MAPGDLATDRPGSWIVAACCCFCNLTFYGIARLSGIMLVATHQTFQVSRASAAVPFSLSTAIRNLAGVFVGHLGHRFGVGPVVASGCLIASLGAALCFFVMDLQWLIVCWGGLFGFGFGLSTCLLPLAINQNFVKHNGMASGISYSGSYLGSFIFPPVVVWLLDSYGLQGTFLVIAGFLLNVLVAALLLNRPKKASRKYVVSASSSQDSLCCDSYKPSKEISVLCKSLEEDGEMLRRNINRAFMDSQYDLACERDKSHLKSGVPLGIPVYASQRTLCQECSSSDKLCSLCCPHSRLSISQHAFLPDLLRDFKFGSRYKEGKDVGSEEGSLREAHSLEADGVSILSFDSSKCSNTYSMGSAARQVPTAPKKCLRKLIDCNLFSKSKCKAKYKLKLQKLKKAVIATILRVRGAGEKSVQPGDVTLTSFKNLQTFLCPSSYKIVIPDEEFHLTVSQRSLFKPCSSGNKELSNFKHLTSPLQDAKSTESVATIFLSEAKEVTNPLSTSDCSLTNSRKYISSSMENDSLTKTSNSSEQSDFNHSFLHAYRNRSEHNFTRNDSTAGCKASNLFYATDQNCNHSCKTVADKDFPRSNIAEDAMSSTDKHTACYSGKSFFSRDSTQNNGIPSFSSELSLRCTPKSESTNENSSIPPPRRKCKAIRRYFSDWFHMLREPMFTVIGFTMSIQTFIVVCVVTTIEDYAKDMGIPENRTYYALMALSISNFVGTLTLGTITDRGFISRHRFLSVCFFGMSLSLVAVSLVAVSLPSLLSLVTIYGLLESGVIITFPILTKEFVRGERRQAVAIASSNVLSAPTVMLVPMLIGHFRDNIGCYSGLFRLLGATSFSCSLLWLVAPYICQKKRLKKNVQDIVTKC